jgi:hypothetical protein
MVGHILREGVVSSLKVIMRLLITLSVLFLTATIVGTATPLLPPPINDPEILIDSDCCSIPITTGINQVQPTGAQTVTYDFFNDTPGVITSFIFQTMINAGLSPQAASSFTCMDNAGFFLGCAVHYDSVSGNLQYSFSGTNPLDADEDGSDSEIGEQEGIPPNGHFKITLQGWTPDVMSAGEQLYSDVPNLDNTFVQIPITDSPEPAVALTLGTGLLALGVMLRRRRTVR